MFICYCSGETSGGAGFPVHGRSLKVLLHQQRGGRPNHISLKNIKKKLRNCHYYKRLQRGGCPKHIFLSELRHFHYHKTLPIPLQVPQLVKMIGPEPSKFNGMSPRIDEILGDNFYLYEILGYTLYLFLYHIMSIVAKDR